MLRTTGIYFIILVMILVKCFLPDEKPEIIPFPLQSVSDKGDFTFNKATLISVENEKQAMIARELTDLFTLSAGFTQDFSCPALLRILLSLSLVSPTGLSPSLTGLSRPFGYLLLCLMQSFYPDSAETESVWALPLSLATTDGIIVIFFSCG